ncbi:hypothetical protein TCSYLVIO_001224 [Trypanosoma cruzi]|nr:hypothetical protein TCSYLVIO_001224 [Trypanosoma cruzi]KAF8278616.1 putative 2OG-Fe(II) oxygenase superfamily [Trypanosoma cruzi]PBJ75971.1 hypothetical protein BCY84_10513 [Trypanosoma cruzi cruzi]PWU89359.1 hypothetical protein C4B63_60g172 [Trypanosoma cruzi]RNF13783.1 hypothetical protein TcG_08220 [Trypanosoma cruzi]
MYSYNNIVDKGEPLKKDVIDRVPLEIAPTEVVLQSRVDERVEVLVVENFLSAAECDRIIAACEEVGYTFWRQKDANAACDAGQRSGETEARAFRVVDTIEACFPQLTRTLSERIQRVVHLEPKLFGPSVTDSEDMFARDLAGTWVPLSLSSNLLLGKYGPGGHFSPHIDGSTVVDLNTRSLYTLLIYLNHCACGGETAIFMGEQADVLELDPQTDKYVGKKEKRVGAVYPKKGSAAFFFCDVLHEGTPVGEGCCKYILRGDFLYRRDPPILTTENDKKAFDLYEQARVAESNGNAMLACELFQRVRKLSNGVAELYQL